MYKAKTKKNGSQFRCVWGKVARPHGSSGVVRARFRNNLPPSSLVSSPSQLILTTSLSLYFCFTEFVIIASVESTSAHVYYGLYLSFDLRAVSPMLLVLTKIRVCIAGKSNSPAVFGICRVPELGCSCTPVVFEEVSLL